MTQSQPIAHAGSNEAEDSQAILEAYAAEFGLVTLERASSFKPDMNQVIPLSLSAEVADTTRPYAGVRDATHVAADQGPAEQSAPSEPPTALKDGTEADGVDSVNLHSNYHNVKRVHHSLPRDDPSQQNSSHRGALSHPSQPIKHPKSAIAATRRMNFSQQTPTQVNDDRDYSEYCDIVPSSPVDEILQPILNEPRTLQNDDTGAVNFGLSELPRPSSQVSEDAGFDNTRGDWRRPEETPLLHSSRAFTPYKSHGLAFETPAVPKNPFAVGNAAVPLAGSQLFGQTQFSSAVKKISPTSSRPSPNLFNSISPNIIETSPLKNRANVSSPTDIRTSSPQRLHEIPDTSLREKDEEPRDDGTPLKNRSTGGEMIPESPQSSDRTPRAKPPQSPPRSLETKGPMTHYVPMMKSQERKMGGEPLVSPLDSDSDSDDAIRQLERRKRVEKKRARAAEEMGKVSFTPRTRSYAEEQPTRKRRRVMSTESNTGLELPEMQPENARKEELRPLVDNSQNGIIASNETVAFASTKASPGETAFNDGQMDGREDNAKRDYKKKLIVEEDIIPATSPASSLPPTAPQDLQPPSASEPELPILRDDETTLVAEERDGEPSSLPPRRTTRTYGRAIRRPRRNPFISSSYSDGITAPQGPMSRSTLPAVQEPVSVPQNGEQHEEAVPLENEPPGDAEEAIQLRASKRISKKPRLEIPAPKTKRPSTDPNPATPMVSLPHGDASATSSSLSTLSATPIASAKTTPGTQESPISKRPDVGGLVSPARSRSIRQKHAITSKSVSPQAVTRVRRMGRRSLRLDSESTDELQHSPGTSALEKSIIYTKPSKSFRQNLPPVQRTGRLFEGMIFAISFSSSIRANERTKLETKVSQAGGTILPEGFQDLFEQSSIMNTTSPIIDEEDSLKLTQANSEIGFAALIADSHSRKAKYMQALALGLPCLAHQWITTCLNKGAIVDWEPYVLCAGVSSVLGNAIRSRMITAYPAVEARLAEIIDQRSRILDGQRILVVVDSRKARSEAKEPYVFLAKVMGPTISRVFNVQQAREVLQEHQKAGNPFDWLYIDKGTGTVEAVLAPPEAVTGKRRRRSAPASQSNPGNIRVLDDELVIQSLILGRMVEEEEMAT
ncbi:hypothetical protein BGZ63DRAFT_424412 [Mariannaea sp. PMI_226]|nr:hypothetical protein BGZ63DRAFT_424412 [Mariannaea sp. PMI_226]